MQIAAREIPPAAALAVDRKLTDRARALKKAGIKGSMSRLRVLAYLERFGVVDPFTVPRPEDGIGGGPIPADDAHDTPDGQEPADGEWPEDWPRDDARDGDDPDDDGPDDAGDGRGGPDPGPGPGAGPGSGGGCACGGTAPTGPETSGTGTSGAGTTGWPAGCT